MGSIVFLLICGAVLVLVYSRKARLYAIKLLAVLVCASPVIFLIIAIVNTEPPLQVSSRNLPPEERQAAQERHKAALAAKRQTAESVKPSANLPRDSAVVRPVKRTSKAVSELDKCAALARRNGVQLSGGLKTRDLGGEMHHYSANATYRGNACRPFVCLFLGRGFG